MMRKIKWVWLVSIFLSVILALPAQASLINQPAPEFTRTDAAGWLDGKPLRMADFRGQVVVVDMWTLSCDSCYRSFWWLGYLEKTYGAQGLKVISIHTPDTEQPPHPDQLRQRLSQAQEGDQPVTHPVMLDDDFRYWDAMQAQGWPTFYLIDKRGVVRDIVVGETHEGDETAVVVDETIKRLLAE